jgi:hypothetical protein
MASYKLKTESEPVVSTIPTASRPQPVVAKGEIMRGWLKEIDGYFEVMQKFSLMESDEIFTCLSSWTARVSHMRSMINRSESKLEQSFRTKQVDPFLSECDRQFKIWSRVFSVQSMDWDMQRKMT